MEEISLLRPKVRVLSYNEAHEFTRRVPTFLTKRQKERDSKIAKQIAYAYDVEENPDKVKEIFFTKSHLLSDPLFWEILRSVWVVCGTTENAKEFRPFFLSKRRAKSWFMTLEDKAFLDSLEFPITLHRAYSKEPDDGISWTNNLDWCMKYAKDRGRKIKTRTFEREDLYAYISRRGESEFIVLNE